MTTNRPPSCDHAYKNFKPLDKRMARGGYAPGEYFVKCRKCECGFTGDKRAYQCADCAYESDEMGARLSDYLKDTTAQELAALRAKAKMVDDGFEDAYVVTSMSGRSVSIDFTEPRAWSLAERLEGIFRCDLESSGYTCRRVRVCAEVEV